MLGAERERAALQEAARQDLMVFIMRCFAELNQGQKLSVAPYLRVLAAKVADSLLGNGPKRLIINLPPRSLKSICVSVAATAWLLGKDPTRRIICASYGKDLASKHARDTLRIMRSDFYRRTFPNTRLVNKKTDDLETTQNGGRMATSMNGVLTGRGGDTLILDDPLKPDDALSEVKRQGVNSCFDNTLLSRLNNKETGVIIIVMQRVHQDDLVGHVLRTNSDWEVFSFPAIAETDEMMTVDTPWGKYVYRRKGGEPLDPTRDSLKVLREIKIGMGSYNFAAQYQQNPAPLGGTIVERQWLVYWDPEAPLPQFTTILQSWDTANKTAELNDYSACTTWGVHNSKYYLLDVFRQKLDYPQLRKAVIRQMERFDPRIILIEDKASGTQLIQQLKSEGVFPIKPYNPPPQTDKVMRLRSQTALFEAGKVIVPKYAAWLDTYLSELLSCPGGQFDDQVDSTTQALDYMSQDRAAEMWLRLAE